MWPRRWDLLAGGAGAAVAAGSTAADGAGGAAGAVVAAALLGAALALTRAAPVTAWAVAVASLLGLVLAEPDELLPLGVIAVVLAHAFAAGRYAPGFRTSVAGAAVLVAALIVTAIGTDDAVVPSILLPGAAWAGGWAVRERELVALRLAERARELEEEREAYAELSVRYERARIASELHDIVAHAISVMVVQAAAGQRLVGVDPELTGEAFTAIAGAARQAEQDMGRLVALLSDEDAIGPAPDLALVGELVARAAGAGLDVTLQLRGTREGFAPATVQAAYRVVQEGLTNAMRYAAGAAVEVIVDGTADALRVEVVNDPGGRRRGELAGQGTGSGLAGLHERVAACHGRVTWGPRAFGGWAVSAALPRRVTPPSPARSRAGGWTRG